MEATTCIGLSQYLMHTFLQPLPLIPSRLQETNNKKFSIILDGFFQSSLWPMQLYWVSLTMGGGQGCRWARVLFETKWVRKYKISLVMAYNNTTSHYPATQLRIHRNIYSLLIAVFGSMP